MDNIVRLDEYRAKTLEKKAFGFWSRRFGVDFSISAKLRDLDDAILLALSQPGDESSEAFYELIMGALDLGQAAKFHYLPNRQQMRVVEVHLFLADQTRFEMIYRLGWIKSLPCAELSLVELVLNHTALQATALANPPELAMTHAAFSRYQAMDTGDKQVFIRQLLTEALEAFEKRCDIDA